MSQVALIDASQVCSRAWAVKEGNPAAVREDILGRIHGMQARHAKRLWCFDSPPYFRATLFSAYKANREDRGPAYDEVKEWLKQQLIDMGEIPVSNTGFEADDLMATLAPVLLENHYSAVVLETVDKDLYQLCNAKVCQQVGFGDDQVFMFGEQVKEKLGVEPYQVPLYLALVGDTADNIPGVPRIGKVTAAKLINKYCHIDAIVEKAKGASTASSKAIAEHEAQLRTAVQLTTLRTDALEESSINVILSRLEDMQQAEEAHYEEPPPAAEDYEPENSTRPTEPAPPPDAELPETAITKSEQPREQQLIKIKHPREPTAAALATSLEQVPLGELFGIARSFFKSGLFHKVNSKGVSSGLDSPDKIFTVLMMARDYGIKSMVMLSNTHIVEGKPTIASHMLSGMVHKSGKCEYLEPRETTAERSVWVTKRKGSAKEVTHVYTIEQAKQAMPKNFEPPREKWMSPSNWVARPAEMLSKTCSSQLVRMVYPDVVSGLYSFEEMG